MAKHIWLTRSHSRGEFNVRYHVWYGEKGDNNRDASQIVKDLVEFEDFEEKLKALSKAKMVELFLKNEDEVELKDWGVVE